MNKVLVQDLFHANQNLQIELVSQEADLQKEITHKEINRPGLSLTGYIKFFSSKRIQIFGKGEWSYLNSLSKKELENVLEQFFSYSMNCIIYAHSNKPPKLFIEYCKKKKIPLFISKLSTGLLVNRTIEFLDEKLSSSTYLHGVFVEVLGVGILIQGESGIGKSETALELVEKGHRLVADDIIKVVKKSENKLFGFVSSNIEHNMEIRGLGIINIKDLFGTGSIRKQMRVDLIIHLEKWNKKNEYDRLGIHNQQKEILGVAIDTITLPVTIGRNIPILIETAAKNYRLKNMGFHAALELDKKIKKIIQEKSQTNTAKSLSQSSNKKRNSKPKI